MSDSTRRQFVRTALTGALAASTSKAWGTVLPARQDEQNEKIATSVPAGRPMMVCSHNGLHHLDDGMAILKSGGDTLDAALAVVNKVEDDPNDDSVGYGGLPNEDGVVELDACVMHGPTRRAGSVASIQKIKNPSQVAKVVMVKTNHVMIVGDGASRFAIDEGFTPMNLLTDRSRLAWLAWKASTTENWRPGLDSPEWKEKMAELLDTPERQAWAAHIEDVVAHPRTGTINCLAVNANGDISGTTTTSGLSWKIAGRVGDSPIIGAGCFVDGDVGGAGSTGRGEENIKISGGHTIVEMMRQGKSPTDACMEALHRVVRNYAIDKSRLKRFHIQFYALNKDGAHAGASLWAKGPTGRVVTYAVHDGKQAQLLPCTPMFNEIGGDY
jgi:N4-(beta-N-acetylglucosaminyl)-L-asparaginase